MPPPAKTQYLTNKRKRQIFADILAVQDSGQMSVPESKRFVATRYNITAKQIEQTIIDGIDLGWVEDLDSMPGISETAPTDDDGA